MSHNLTFFKIKKIKNLVIDKRDLFTHYRDDWYSEIKEDSEGYLIIEGRYEQKIKAKPLHKGFLELLEMDLTGEGSGSFWNYVLEPALKKSTGKLKAIMIWEGEEFYKLKLKDGELIYKELK